MHPAKTITKAKLTGYHRNIKKANSLESTINVLKPATRAGKFSCLSQQKLLPGTCTCK